MKWPFRAKRPHADVRAFRHPKTGELTLRLDGQLGIPSKWEQPIVAMYVRLEAPLSSETAELLACGYGAAKVNVLARIVMTCLVY